MQGKFNFQRFYIGCKALNLLVGAYLGGLVVDVEVVVVDDVIVVYLKGQKPKFP